MSCRNRYKEKNSVAVGKIADNPAGYESILTEWELRFVVDVSARYTRDYEMSAKQLAVVEKILRKARLATEQK